MSARAASATIADERGEVDAAVAVDHGLGVAEAAGRVADHGRDRRPGDLAAHRGAPLNPRLAPDEKPVRMERDTGLSRRARRTIGTAEVHPDHEYHPLTVAAVVDETADTRSFVLEIPPELADTFAYAAGQFCTFRATDRRRRGRLAATRCRARPTWATRFTTTVKRVPDGRDVQLDDRHARAGRHDRRDAPGRAVRAPRRRRCRSSPSPAGAGSRRSSRSSRPRCATTERDDRARVRQPRRRLRDLRGGARPPRGRGGWPADRPPPPRRRRRASSTPTRCAALVGDRHDAALLRVRTGPVHGRRRGGARRGSA